MITFSGHTLIKFPRLNEGKKYYDFIGELGSRIEGEHVRGFVDPKNPERFSRTTFDQFGQPTSSGLIPPAPATIPDCDFYVKGGTSTEEKVFELSAEDLTDPERAKDKAREIAEHVNN